MFDLISGIIRWIFSKAFLLTLLWVVGLSSVAAYLYYRNYMAELPEERRVRLEQLVEIDRQIAEVGRLAGETRREFDLRLKQTRDGLREATGEIDRRTRELQDLAEDIRKLRGMWERFKDFFSGSNEQELKVLERQEREARQHKTAAEKAEAELRIQRVQLSQQREQSLMDLRSDGDLLQQQREEKAQDLAGVELAIAKVKVWLDPFRFWFRQAWEKAGRELILISLLLIFGPLLFKVFKYFVLAPLISQAEPVQLPALIGMNNIRLDKDDKGVSVELRLSPGEVLLMKSKFLQSSEEEIRKRTQFVFSWRYPFTSLAAGLVELTRIFNTDPVKFRSVTISCQSEPEVEMAMIHVPAGGSVILRPSMLAAVAYQADARPAIKSHWRIFKLHAWLTLQFRYFEFQGPVRLVVWAWRGVRVEQLSHETGQLKRTNQDSTIGFTPGLEYSCTRAETFWAYLRGWNPLFDDLFRGEGSFLCQEIAGGRSAMRRGRFWESLWNGITKIFGI